MNQTINRYTVDNQVAELCEEHGIQHKLGFEVCPNIGEYHGIIKFDERQDSFVIQALETIMINGFSKNLGDGFIPLKANDMIFFPCEICVFPHFYHLILPLKKSQMQSFTEQGVNYAGG